MEKPQNDDFKKREKRSSFLGDLNDAQPGNFLTILLLNTIGKIYRALKKRGNSKTK